jgi:plastocyanin
VAPAALINTPVPPAATPPAPTGPATPEPPKIEWLGVTAEEWSLTLSHSSVAAGETIVELNNEGSDSHDLALQREGETGPPLTISEAAPEEQRSARFTLSPGTYRLWCDLPEHKEKGMSVSLVVGGG